MVAVPAEQAMQCYPSVSSHSAMSTASWMLWRKLLGICYGAYLANGDLPWRMTTLSKEEAINASRTSG